MTLYKTSAIVLSCFLLITLSCKTPEASTDSVINSLTSEEESEGWKLLFDGKSTDTWRGYLQDNFPQKGWYIDEEGSLCVTGGGGDIITKDKFENFDLKVDFMVSDTGNSGIFYRAAEMEDMAIWNNAHEYQILDDSIYSLIDNMDMHTHKTGDNYDLHAAKEYYSKPVGEWNTARIRAEGNDITYWLNGQKTVEFTIGSASWDTLINNSKFSIYPDFGRIANGHIGLQDHGHLIKFRNIKIKPLPSSYTSIFNGKNLDGWEIYGTEKWYVEDGLLVCESGPEEQYGYLATNNRYKNFDLSVDFLQEADGNSGIFFRSSIEGTKITGWQAEVAPPGSNTGGIYESYGRGWLIQPDSTLDTHLKMGEWNNMRIYVNRNHVITWLNGHQMVNFQDDKIGEAMGQVALQIHDGGGIKVKWKEIKIKEL